LDAWINNFKARLVRAFFLPLKPQAGFALMEVKRLMLPICQQKIHQALEVIQLNICEPFNIA
jgi:hypothetical protein